ncbi:MAG: hypothetical protein AAGG56_11190 [Pseudomonadota bacterium]
MPERRLDYPKLLEERGLPGPDEHTMSALRDIVDEGVLGASNHVALALPLVARTAEAHRASAVQEALALAEFIAQTRGVAAPIVANALSWLTDGIDGLPPSEAGGRLHGRAAEWQSLTRARRARLVAHAAKALASRRAPLLFDYSSTVSDVVRALAETAQIDRIIVPESRSIEGGRRFLEDLSGIGADFVFLPDAALDYAVASCDAVLLGAESVTRDGGVINTIGSVIAARCAKARNVPVYGAADLFKVGERMASEIGPFELRSYDFLLPAGQLASTRAPELEVVPPALIAAILTEAGALAPEKIAGEAAAARSSAEPVSDDA